MTKTYWLIFLDHPVYYRLEILRTEKHGVTELLYEISLLSQLSALHELNISNDSDVDTDLIPRLV